MIKPTSANITYKSAVPRTWSRSTNMNGSPRQCNLHIIFSPVCAISEKKANLGYCSRGEHPPRKVPPRNTIIQEGTRQGMQLLRAPAEEYFDSGMWSHMKNVPSWNGKYYYYYYYYQQCEISHTCRMKQVEPNPKKDVSVQYINHHTHTHTQTHTHIYTRLIDNKCFMVL